jgi:hypothetical protein
LRKSGAWNGTKQKTQKFDVWLLHDDLQRVRLVTRSGILNAAFRLKAGHHRTPAAANVKAFPANKAH